MMAVVYVSPVHDQDVVDCFGPLSQAEFEELDPIYFDQNFYTMTTELELAA